jgi:hypothetical protein
VTKFLQSVLQKITPCPDSADKLALDYLSPLLSRTISNYLDVWLSNSYSADYWGPLLEGQQGRLDSLRTWANGIPDRCARKAYLGWIDFYQGKLDSAREELRTHATEKRQNAINQRIRDEQESKKKYAEQVDGAFPRPPQ